MVLLFKNAGTSAFDPCTFDLDQQGLINITAGGFASSIVTDPYVDFRYYDWVNSSLPETDKLLIIGTYRNDQLNPLKLKYADSITTIGISYDQNQLLLNNLAKQHISLLAAGKITRTDLDNELLTTKSTQELIDYYSTAFDQQNLVPKSDSVDCDYLIPLTDFYNKSAMVKHLNNLALPFTTESEEFYDQWLALNQTSV